MKVFMPADGRSASVQERITAPEMSLMGHLEELRGRLFKIVVAYAVASTAAWFLYEHLLRLLISPLAKLPAADQILRNGQLIYTAPTEAFLVRLKVVAFAGLILALPIILWQLWRFVTPGLHKHEKRYALPFVLVSMVLFALGVSVAFTSLPKALEVLAGFAGNELVLLPKAADYLSFVLLLIVAFGVSFEFPIVLLGLTIVGVLSSEKLRRFRRAAWVIILVVAAVITPTQDPITLVMMSIPLGLLFEATVVTARLMKK